MKGKMLMASDNLISVIVPVYNVEQYLEKCIESILNQTYKNLQIILVDDGSTDSSGNICDYYMNKDRRIQVIHKINGGLVTARKAGLKIANGQYIGFVDGDDWIDTVMYEEMYTNLLETGADYVHMGLVREMNGYSFSDCGFETEVIELPAENIELMKSFLGENKGVRLDHKVTTKLFRNEIIKQCYINVPDGQDYGEDYLAVLECIFQSRRISFLKNAYYHYVCRTGSYTNTFNGKTLFWIAKVHENAMCILKKYRVQEALLFYQEQVMARDMLYIIDQSGFYKNHIPFFYIEEVEKLIGKKIVLYGAGNVGYDLYMQLSKYQKIHIVEWIDKNFSKYSYKEMEVHGLETINEMDYDIVLIAVKRKNVASDMKKALEQQGVDGKKIYWKEPKYFI